MRYEDENIWLTQKMMATLYDVSVPAINQHIKKIFEDGELISTAVIKDYLITAVDGKQYNTKHYNLQMIIAVGFKVNSDRSVQFRKWAGQIVKDYTIQGWTMDVGRLKNGHMFTDEYFDRQLEYIREIRLSERKFYQKIMMHLCQDISSKSYMPVVVTNKHVVNNSSKCIFDFCKADKLGNPLDRENFIIPVLIVRVKAMKPERNYLLRFYF